MNPDASGLAPSQNVPSDQASVVGPALLIGAGGMLGRAWLELLRWRKIDHTPTTRQQLDILDRTAIDRESIHPDIKTVINCTAWTDVDGAESNYDTAAATNGAAVESLAQRCAATGATLVHYSTDYVFDGHAARPYPTDHKRDPINAYGRSKEAGERAIERAGCPFLIIRTSWLYAPWGKNFVDTIAGLVKNRDSIRVVDDQRGRPTSCQHLAAMSLKLIEKGAKGVYHVTDGGQCTWFEFASEIARRVGSDCRVDPCPSDEYPRPAIRPAYSVLDLSKTTKLIGAMPPWQENLAAVIRQMQEQPS